jgi:hypothetical protein
MEAEMHNLKKSMAMPCLILSLGLASSVEADVIENLTFAGSATCGDANCSSFGSGPVFGSYTADITSGTVVGPWSFSTPLGVMSSTTAGSDATIVDRFGDINVAFEEATPFEFIQFFFPAADTQLIGALASNIVSDACTPASTSSCYPDYTVTGVGQLTSTVTTPEPSTLMLIGAALLATGLFGRKLSSRKFGRSRR